MRREVTGMKALHRIAHRRVPVAVEPDVDLCHTEPGAAPKRPVR